MNATRRGFMAGATAAIAVAAAPGGATLQAVAPTTAPVGWWGYSYDGDIFNQMDGVTTREQAIAYAMNENPDGGLHIALCDPYELAVPDFRENLTEHMCGCSDTLKEAMVRAATGINEDADYEGEIEGAIEASDTTELLADAQAAMDAAFVRHGRPELVGRDFYQEYIESDDPLLALLDKDDEFGTAPRRLASAGSTGTTSRRPARSPCTRRRKNTSPKSSRSKHRPQPEEPIVNKKLSVRRIQDAVDIFPMLLWCPACGQRHIDEGDFASKPHHTHACQHCGMVWRPARVNTVGVQFLPGYKN